jgi:hypothetical protein
MEIAEYGLIDNPNKQGGEPMYLLDLRKPGETMREASQARDLLLARIRELECEVQFYKEALAKQERKS